jgi:hypothetical protein
VITSCCGALFSANAGNVTADIIGFPQRPMEIAFFANMLLLFGCGIFTYHNGKAAYVFAVTAGVAFLISLASFISFISIYIYELPTHHCPFCVLQQEYGCIGYPLFLALLGGGQAGMGVGILTPYRETGSLKEILPAIQKRLILISLTCYAAFTIIIIYKIIFSNLKM